MKRRHVRLPQITTREAGDVVRDGVEGIIVKPGDVNAIAAALEHLYRHPEIVQRNGRRSATSRRREFHLGPFSSAIAGCVRNRDAHAR